MFEILNAALAGMTGGPKKLSRALDYAAEDMLDGDTFDQKALLAALKSAGPGDDTLGLLRRRLATWDNESGDWAGDTPSNSAERRKRIYERLGFDHDWTAFSDERLPFQPLARPTVIAIDHDRWYTPTIRAGRDYYWKKYAEQLIKQGWQEDSVLQLDDSTSSVVERLADPTAETAYQAKGLVIGYVQSGKTANFTGVIAKAADAGYRLIIVLGGMLDVLRSQTQRRIDKELVGRELLFREYVNDPDWDEFLSHGAKPSDLGTFDLSRLTGPEEDYQRLALGVEALKFAQQNAALPFNHPDNLFKAPARIAVLKKNSKVVQRLLSDLAALGRQKLGAPLDQVPVLIIDDESDQASINTKKPTPGAVEEERNATNKAIVDLLKLLPRAQYVGYTATPFANVFVDPASEGDIFPKDFLIALPRPVGYMGVSDFYDLEAGEEEEKPNRRNFVRSVVGEDSDPKNLQTAIDSYVLAGAIKLWRLEQDAKLKFRHHTMLVHVSQLVLDHKALAVLVRKTYSAAGYDGGKGLDRLAKLFIDDFSGVHQRRGSDLPFPASFDELAPSLGDCLQRIGEAGDAVLVVNNDTKDQTPDFDKQSVWKILVGGTKLSRGYTVEGLTVSYYRRRAGAGDTLMQMGRWFGFRRGYNDLVRLFIGTKEKKTPKGSATIDLYEAFGGVCRDEELFRKDLERYASMEEPRMTPAKIPPLVPQHMLRPTAANKMRNAVIQFRNFGGQLAESTFAPHDPHQIRHNNDALAAMLSGAAITQTVMTASARGSLRALGANTALFSTQKLLEFLNAYRWYDPKSREASAGNPLRLQVEFLQGKAGAHLIEDWLLLGPKITAPRAAKDVNGTDFDVVYRSRHEQQDYRFHTYNDPVHRAFAQHISGQIVLPQADSTLNALVSTHRGVMIYYPVTDEKGSKSSKAAKGPFTVGFTLLFPENPIVSPLGFTVRMPDKPEEAVITVDS
ncbi:Z1 domain-containing protein [Mesorhizobium sp.]|uniref:Z1 domain-containing protein n=1 Tax=Mesorhizobium sp. TaxID=1871066 RepID=UPI000FEA9941|nr:Z1 domain-containing protein [Mesorhizobium sp.]RWK48111.1 MAG: endonuclease [Mesorhizobium sp.]